jgi:hypothetical protein
MSQERVQLYKGSEPSSRINTKEPSRLAVSQSGRGTVARSQSLSLKNRKYILKRAIAQQSHGMFNIHWGRRLLNGPTELIREKGLGTAHQRILHTMQSQINSRILSF